MASHGAFPHPPPPTDPGRAYSYFDDAGNGVVTGQFSAGAFDGAGVYQDGTFDDDGDLGIPVSANTVPSSYAVKEFVVAAIAAFSGGDSATTMTSTTLVDPTFDGDIKGASTAVIFSEDAVDILDLDSDNNPKAIMVDSDNKLATCKTIKAFVERKVSDIVGGAPELLDTLSELASALSDSPDTVTALTTLVGTKQHVDGTTFHVKSDDGTTNVFNVDSTGTTATGAVTCSKAEGTGLTVDSDATIGGTLAVTGTCTAATLTTTGDITVGGALTIGVDLPVDPGIQQLVRKDLDCRFGRYVHHMSNGGYCGLHAAAAAHMPVGLTCGSGYTITDGVLKLTSGSISDAVNITATGDITGGTITDGSGMTSTGGNLSATTLTATVITATTSISAPSISTTGTWGTGTITGNVTGDLTGSVAGTTITASGDVTLDAAEGNLNFVVKHTDAVTGEEATVLVADTSHDVVQISNLVTTKSITNYSDRRIKTDIAPTQLEAVEIIRNINCVEFKRTDIAENNYSPIGFIAQEIEELLPYHVEETAAPHCEEYDTLLSVRTTDFVPLLVKAVQELSDKIIVLEARLAKFE